MPKEQALEMLKRLATECAGKEGASAADIDEIMAGALPTTKTGKCLRYCIGESLGLVCYM